MASSDITIPNFEKIGRLVQNMSMRIDTHTHTRNRLISQAFFSLSLDEGKQAKNEKNKKKRTRRENKSTSRRGV
jgi:hypothetical protein